MSDYYSELKNYTVNPSEPYLNHYCYTEVNIFSTYDSIQNVRIRDSDFDTTAGYMPAKNKIERDERYSANLSSKWNSFLNSIDSQLANMPETKVKD